MAINLVKENTYLLGTISRKPITEIQEESNLSIFPFEHITFSNRFHMSTEVSSLLKDSISLENYDVIRENKYSYLNNVCGKLDANSIVRELSLIQTKSIIIDSGTDLFKFRNDGSYALYLDQESHKKILSISSQLEKKADILVGITIDFNIDSEKTKDIILNELRNLLILNYNNSIVPSFIIMNIQNHQELNVCLSLSLTSEFSIPILAQLSLSEIFIVSEFLVKCKQVFDSRIDGNRYYNAKIKSFSQILQKFVFVISTDVLGNEAQFNGFTEFENESNLSTHLTNILDQGCNIIFGVLDKDEKFRDKLKNSNIGEMQQFIAFFESTNDYNHPFKELKAKKMLEFHSKYPNQILFSNNISFLLEHSLSGGKGYNLRDTLINKYKKSQKEFYDSASKSTTLRLFAWWRMPEKEIKKIDTITCSFCKSIKPDDSDVIRKSESIFCDVACLSKYNKSKLNKK